MADLEQFCNALGWRMARLAPLADVDTFEDLDALKRVVGDDARPARRALGAWLANDGHRPETQP